MDLEKLTRQLRLMTLLTQNKTYSIEEVGRMVGMSKRTIYRYIDAFRQAGFIVVKEGTRYRLDHRSPFFREITELIHFTDDEALTISHVLNSVYDNSSPMRHLREKLSRLYDPEVLARHEIDERVAQNMSRLFQAIREGRMCILRGYNSPHSGRKSDRVVEPYQFLSQNTEVRCWEPASQANKTFKISRMDSVDLMDLLWTDTEKHAAVFTDLFHFSGEQQVEIRLLMGRLATSLLLEEYPFAAKQLQTQPDGRHLLTTHVASYVGAARFVLGLYDDIEVVGDDGFKQYLKEAIRKMQEKA